MPYKIVILLCSFISLHGEANLKRPSAQEVKNWIIDHPSVINEYSEEIQNVFGTAHAEELAKRSSHKIFKGLKVLGGLFLVPLALDLLINEISSLFLSTRISSNFFLLSNGRTGQFAALLNKTPFKIQIALITLFARISSPINTSLFIALTIISQWGQSALSLGEMIPPSIIMEIGSTLFGLFIGYNKFQTYQNHFRDGDTLWPEQVDFDLAKLIEPLVPLGNENHAISPPNMLEFTTYLAVAETWLHQQMGEILGLMALGLHFIDLRHEKSKAYSNSLNTLQTLMEGP